MHKILVLTAMLAALPLTVASAESAKAPAGSMEVSDLPAACAAASADQSDMSKLMNGVKGMGDMVAGSAVSDMMGHSMGDAGKASMQSMATMQASMAQAMTIEDPDMAFNCGMIAHHLGAIAMAKVELDIGKDEASKARAQTIITDQQKEVGEMTDWVESHAK